MLKTDNPRKTRYYLIQYNENNYRILKNKYQLEKGWLLTDKSQSKIVIKDFLYKLFNIDNITNKEEIERISLSRTKSRIRELALCNNFEYFGTITVNGYLCNRYELDDCQDKLKKILDLIHRERKRNNKDKLKYIIITEKHKDGAFHFHGLFSGIDLSLNEYGYFYNEELSKLGYNSFSLIKNYSKCCSYITKYITKDCVRNSKNQIFIRSKGLIVATKEEIKPIELGNDWKFENDFVSIYDFNLQNTNELDKKIITDLLGNNI